MIVGFQKHRTGLAVDGHGADTFLNSGADGIGAAAADGDHRRAVAVAGEVQIEVAFLRIADDQGSRAVGGGDVGFLGKADAAALAEDHLAGHIQVFIVLLGAVGIQEEEFKIHTGADGVQAGEIAVAEAAVLGVDDLIAVYGEIAAHRALVVHRCHGQGIGIGAGHAHGVEAGSVVIQVAAGPGLLRPVAGVACGHDHHGIGLLQVFQEGGVDVVEGGARVGTAEGQVHRITAEQNGILNGGHVVGFVGTAQLAEDLHGEELGIRSRTGGVDGFHGIGIAVFRGDEAVGGGDAGHMGAVLALAVPVMGHVVIAVHIVEGKGQLFAEIELLSGHIGLFGDVQAAQDLRQLPGVQQVQGCQIGIRVHICLLGAEGQGVKIRAVVEGLVIGVRARVDDGHTGARAGKARAPGGVGSGHDAGGVGHGLNGALGGHGGVLLLLNHGLHAVDGRDGVDVAALDIGGDHIAHQGQVPDHIQGLTPQDLTGDGLGHALLLGQKLGIVGHGGGVFGDVHGGKARLYRGPVLQNDGDADGPGDKLRILRIFLSQTVT